MNSTKKERAAWADICKGLLIVLLMFSHLVWVSRSQYCVSNYSIELLSKYCGIWSSFFMSCFFLLSGMFSNFYKKPLDFVATKFKTLIFPAIVVLALVCLPSMNYSDFISILLLYGGGQWFLSSLFLSSLFLYVCIKYIKRGWVVMTLLVALSFAGKLFDDMNFFPNYWYHRNFMNFSLFLGLGYYYKDYLLKKIVGRVSAFSFALTILVFFVMGMRIPNVVSNFNESIVQHPLSILLSITGSLTCIYVCKLIAHNAVLEYFGRISLIVYLYHMIFLPHCIRAILPAMNGAAIVDSLFQVIMIILGTLFSCFFIAKVLDCKYLKWMKGVF